MKKTMLAAPLAALLFLSGCGKDARATPETAAALYQGAAVTAEIAVSAFGEYPADYGAACTVTDGDASVEILSPADVAGVRLTVSGESATLSYDGAMLETLLPALPGYTPADVLPGLVRAVAEEKPLDWGYERYGEEDALALTFQDDFPSVTGLRRVWLRESDCALLGAECYLDDSMALRMRSVSFVLTPAK